MQNLNGITQEIEGRLDDKDAIREVALKSSRAITRLSSSVIHGIHKKEDTREMLQNARDEAKRLKSLLEEHQDLYHSGFVQNAQQELAEASLLMAIVDGNGLPDPHELGITDTSYLLGLGDVVGELRRFALEDLQKGDVAQSAKYLQMMDDIYVILMRFDYPTALVAVKRKQDIARSIIERTRGDVAVATRGKSLESKIAELEGKL